MEQTACEDLKAFERRLTEVIAHMQPSASKWRAVLLLTSVCAAIGAYQWITDPTTPEVSFSYSLYNHLFFTISLTSLLLLFFCGIHKRVVAPSITMTEEQMWSRNDFVEIFSMLTLIVATIFIIFGGVIPYYFQHREIRRTQNAKGFSLFVCLNLLSSNILRILFWFGKHFEIQLLIQSVIMVLCMLVMIEVSVRVSSRQSLPPNHRRHTVWDGDFVSHFWAWSDFGSYLLVAAAFTVVAAIVNYAFRDVGWFVETVGFTALFLEANLGTPQFLSNWNRKSTLGMSISMVLLWLLGDISKTIYFVVRHTPPQFWVCGLLQVGVDIAIISQIFLYKAAKLPHDAKSSSTHL